MMNSETGRNAAMAAHFPPNNHGIADDLGPMPQQDTLDTHGYAMYPQKFVRLVGCHLTGEVPHDTDGSAGGKPLAEAA